MKVEYRPVEDKHGEVQCIDIFVDGRWHGSRRTPDQCEHYVKQIEKKP